MFDVEALVAELTNGRRHRTVALHAELRPHLRCRKHDLRRHILSGSVEPQSADVPVSNHYRSSSPAIESGPFAGSAA
jgi:hypothetical protein